MVKQRRTKEEWDASEAAMYLRRLGLFIMSNGLYYALGRAFQGYSGQEFDGSLKQLAEIACGIRYIRNVGEKGRQRITWAFLTNEGIL